MKPLRETDIVKACLDYLALRRIFHVRANSGSVTGERNGKRRYVAFQRIFIPAYGYVESGATDIYAILRGVHVCIEVKRPGQHSTPNQIRFQNAVTAAGGLALEVHSADELMKALEGQ